MDTLHKHKYGTNACLITYPKTQWHYRNGVPSQEYQWVCPIQRSEKGVWCRDQDHGSVCVCKSVCEVGIVHRALLVRLWGSHARWRLNSLAPPHPNTEGLPTDCEWCGPAIGQGWQPYRLMDGQWPALISQSQP